MDTKALKDKILQLAIQGKLVPQDENDEHASVLLKRIEEEKEQLIKDKVIKKEKSLAEISDDEKLFEIPKTWEWIRCSDIFNVRSAMRIHKTDWRESGIPFFRGRELVQLAKDGTYDAQIYIEEELYEKFKEKSGIPQKDDILVSAVGTIGKVYVVKASDKFYYKDAYILCFENFGGICSKYIKYMLESQQLQCQIKKDSMATTVAQLTIMKAKSLIMPIPPLEEQKRIASKIDLLFKLIDELDNNKNDLLQNISDSRKKVLQLAIQGKLVSQDEKDEPASVLLEKIKEEKEQLIKDKVIKKEKALPEITDDEKSFELPNGWEWTRLGIVGYFQKGYAFKSKDYIDEGIRITKVSNLNNPKSNDVVYIDKSNEEVYEQYKLYIGDLILTTVGSWPTAPSSVVGNVIYVDEKFDGTLLNQNAVRIRSKSNSKYVNLVLKSRLFKDYIVDIAQGTANQASITQDGIKSFILPLPPLEEQKRIVDKVDAIMNYLDMLENQIN